MKKLQALKSRIGELKEATVCLSGGVDSSAVAKAAYDVLKDRARAVTIKTEFIPEEDVLNAVRIAKEIGIKHKIVCVNLLDEEIEINPENRCYLCKLRIISSVPGKIILDGTNADDDPKRPGLAAIEELGVISPLKETGITKQEVRQIASDMGLTNWSKPQNSCLATRIPFGTRITMERLKIIEKAESTLHKLGITDCRARLHSDSITLVIPKSYKESFEKQKNFVDKEIPVNDIKWI